MKDSYYLNLDEKNLENSKIWKKVELSEDLAKEVRCYSSTVEIAGVYNRTVYITGGTTDPMTWKPNMKNMIRFDFSKENRYFPLHFIDLTGI